MKASYWIVTITLDNLDLAKEHGVVGVPGKRRRLISKMAEGDIIVFYVSKKKAGSQDYKHTVSEFGPIMQVVGKVYHDDDPMWHSKGDETYPWRRRITLILDASVKAANVVRRLSFIQDKPRWGLFFVTGVREISRDDYEILRKEIEQAEGR